jgi:hypothetical protein
MKRTSVCLPALLIAALAGYGCENSPTAPTQQVITETFIGTVARQGNESHPFTVKEDGPVTITVLNVTRETPVPPGTPLPPAVTNQPPATEDDPTAALPPPIYIGLAIGMWNGTTCQRIAQRTDASLLTTISGSAKAGDFCVAVFDPGGDVITLPVDYQVEAHHF